jgi:multidrug efflux pump
MTFSALFIRRPIATVLLSAGLLMAGAVAYFQLPVASLPNVDMPTLRVMAGLPGADPETMAATVAAPLERRIGEIAGITQMTSTSQLNSTSINVQFELSRSVENAARDVQAAINAAQSDLPSSLSRRPTLKKMNPAARPILILALTSPIRKPTEVYDIADLVVSTRIMQVNGVADVTVSGAQQPAIRVTADVDALKARGLGLEDIRTAITASNSFLPLGRVDIGEQSLIITTDGQMSRAEDYANIVVKSQNGAVTRLADVARVRQSTADRLASARFDRDPAVLLIIQKTSEANVVKTVDGIRALIPQLSAIIPPDVKISVVNDRTTTIRSSVRELQITLTVSVALVMLVVFVFLRRIIPTIAAGLAVPLSLAGTVVLMYFADYSLDNMSLLALVISVGFVVDDAIVMIENCYRNMQLGMKPLQAALVGSRQIGFTIVSMSLSLIAAFMPLLLMGGPLGRVLREFAWTLAFAIIISAVVSLTLTPMICGRFMRGLPRPRETWFDRRIEPFMEGMLRNYLRSLDYAIAHRWLMLMLTLVMLGLSVQLYALPKGLVPGRRQLIFGFIAARPTFRPCVRRRSGSGCHPKDEDVAGVGSSIGSGGYGSSNQGRVFISLKPHGVRKGPASQVIDRLRKQLRSVTELQATMFPATEITLGPRQTRSQYQITVWSDELAAVTAAVPQVQAAIKSVQGVTDVATDRELGGPQAMVEIDRLSAARVGLSVRSIDATLNDAFSQRQISTIYGEYNQYKVVQEIDPALQRDMSGLNHVYVTNNKGTEIPLVNVTRITRSTTPLAVNHQGQFPSVTISFNLEGKLTLGEALPKIMAAVDKTHQPPNIHVELSGDTQMLAQQQSGQAILILAAIITVYLVLGILYEDLVHPLTILSTLPSAGFGALLILYATGTELSLVALIGIILLIGIVKKNGIMLVDFALEAERHRGLRGEAAIREACRERFRPILMTTLAAMMGALPLLLSSGPGSELRWPLGLTIISGLAVSQLLTIYTTPVIYLWLDKLRGKGGWRRFIRRSTIRRRLMRRRLIRHHQWLPE